MIPKISFGKLIFCLGLLTVGCNDIPAQIPQSAYIVNQAAPTKSESSFNDQSLDLWNCDGKAEHTSLADQVQVVCNVTISDNAISSTTGNSLELTADLKALLSEEVKQAYQQMYDEATAQVEQTDLTVPAGRIRTFLVYWTQQTISSTISFTRDGQTYSAPYTYTLDIPKSTVKMETGCTG